MNNESKNIYELFSSLPPKQQETLDYLINNTSLKLRKQFYEDSNAFNYFNNLMLAIKLKYIEKFSSSADTTHSNSHVDILWRIKGLESFTKNIEKEFPKLLTNFKETNQIDLTPITKDFVAGTLVTSTESLNIINNKDFMDYLSDDDSARFLELRKQVKEFSDLLFEVTDTPSLDSPLTQSKYITYKIKLLKSLAESTYDECTSETSGIPYRQQLEYFKSYLLNNEELLSADENSLISEKQLDELNHLSTELSNRQYDKYQAEFLRISFPYVMNDPIFSNYLQISSCNFIKNVKKPNGFVADYFELQTPYGIIEMQTTSKHRYLESKQGNCAHVGMNNKKQNISDFFELTDSNDSHELSYYLQILDSYPHSYISPEALEDNNRTSLYLKDILKHIKIKDTFYNKDFKSYFQEWVQDTFPCMFKTSTSIFSPTAATTNALNTQHTLSALLSGKNGLSCLSSILLQKVQSLPQINNGIYSDPTNSQSVTLNDVKKYCIDNLLFKGSTNKENEKHKKEEENER